jgi:glycosyltransferase involved in cell wall biosynthesis
MSLLTIFIPTYNRSSLLDECLRIIYDELMALDTALQNQVEIVVSNNCSTDNTEEVVRNYQRLLPSVRYNYNEANLGADANIGLALKFSNYKYLWIIGDDDHIEKGALKTLLLELEKAYPSVILNYSVWDAKMMKKVRSKKFKISNDLYINHDEIMKMFGPHLGFISMLIIDKNLLKIGFKECENTSLITPGWPLLAGVYAALRHTDDKSIFIHKVMIRNRSGNSHLSNWDEIFVDGFWQIFSENGGLNYSKRDLSLARALVVKDFIFWRIVYQLYLEKNSEKSLRYANLYPKFGDTAVFWTRVFPLLVLGGSWPIKFIIKYLLPLYYYLKQKKDGQNEN